MCMWSIGSVARFSVNSHDLGILAEIVVATTAAIQIHSALDHVHFARNTATICTTIRAPDNYSLPRAIHGVRAMKFSEKGGERECQGKKGKYLISFFFSIPLEIDLII